mmetsp:Transcript_8431/g.28295  ORF Transcript_8431/g.28295 Transcript_8431/m.28295 type:complete len:200 (+) Transcript_8431:184-783(+)
MTSSMPICSCSCFTRSTEFLDMRADESGRCSLSSDESSCSSRARRTTGGNCRFSPFSCSSRGVSVSTSLPGIAPWIRSMQRWRLEEVTRFLKSSRDSGSPAMHCSRSWEERERRLHQESAKTDTSRTSLCPVTHSSPKKPPSDMVAKMSSCWSSMMHTAPSLRKYMVSPWSPAWKTASCGASTLDFSLRMIIVMNCLLP